MPIKVVTTSHIRRDDTAEVPSVKDFENLDQKISSIKQSLSLRVTETIFESEVASLKKKLDTTKDSIVDLRKSIINILENGEWKKTFRVEIQDALQQLETRYDELNTAIDKKMQTLPRLDLLEDKINTIFIQQNEKIKEIIIVEGENARKKIQLQLEQCDWLTILADRTKKISWEK